MTQITEEKLTYLELNDFEVILLLDTFQIQLSSIFPNLEVLLYNLYETIKDMTLFTKDLIK